MTEPEIVEEKESDAKEPADGAVEPEVEAVKQDELKEPELVEELTEEKHEEETSPTKKEKKLKAKEPAITEAAYPEPEIAEPEFIEGEPEEPEEETESAKTKYQFIEDLPGVGPATAQKLQELGYHTVESLAMATIRELEPVGVSEKKAFQIISAARSTMGLSFVRADELFKRRQAVQRLTSGIQGLDNLLAGGI